MKLIYLWLQEKTKENVMKVKCVKDYEYNITLGKIYDVHDVEYNAVYVITGDDGDSCCMKDFDNFEVVL